MSQYVWHVSTVGGDPAQVTAAIEHSIARLRDRGSDLTGTGLGADELEPWTEDISHVHLDTTATEDGVSVLVDVTLYGDRDIHDERLAAILSGGFDEVVLDAVLDVDGVIGASHSDRIPRPV